MSKTRPAYFCYTCSEEVTFRGTRIRYNLGGSLHLCKADDKVAYEKYRKYTYDNTGWRLTGEDFWKWKRDIYDVQRWTQSRDYYNELKEQRERDQHRAAEVEAEQRRKTAEAEAQRRKAAEEAEAQRREEQRKQASREKRRAARKRRKQREQAEADARERERQAKGRRRRHSSHSHEPRPGGRLDMEALKIMGLTVDILRLSSKEAVTVVKNRFRTLAMKFHPDRGGDPNKFMAMNEAYEHLLHHLLNKI